MARSSRSFKLAAQSTVDEEKASHEDIEYEFMDPDAVPEGSRKTVDPKVLVAHYPGEGQMFVMSASIGMSDDQMRNPAGALFSFLRASFSPQDYQWLFQQVKLSRLDPREDLMDMVGDMIVTWTGVPTRQ